MGDSVEVVFGSVAFGADCFSVASKTSVKAISTDVTCSSFQIVLIGKTFSASLFKGAFIACCEPIDAVNALIVIGIEVN